MAKPDPKPAPRRKRRREAPTAAERRASLAFKRAVAGRLCASCGRSEADLGVYAMQAHHVVRQQVLRRLGLDHLRWVPEAAVALCEEPCHRRHTSRHTRLPLWRLSLRNLAFAVEHGLVEELLREHPP